MSEYLMEVKDLVKHYPIHGGVLMREVARVHALNGVSFKVKAGETLGIVGESGCGKSTLGKTLVRLHEHTDGYVDFQGEDFLAKKGQELKEARKNIQMIFQDPYESLNSRHTIENILTEPYEIHGVYTKEERRERAVAALKTVGLSEQALERFPHEFSGGQRQRIGIARAIALEPQIIVCDEPVSALDVSVQSQVMNLLLKLQEEMGLTYLFIAHDLAVVKHISDRVMVMYLGSIVEFTDAEQIYENPLHPYTQALISAIPIPDPDFEGEKIVLEGDIPSPINLPSGCPFHTRCRYAQDKCKVEKPELQDAPGTSGETHLVACHFAGNLPNQ